MADQHAVTSTADTLTSHAEEPLVASIHTGIPSGASIHELLRELRRLGNEVRLGFLAALRSVYDNRLYYEIGHSSFHQYCDRELGLRRSTAYEYVRVAEALDGLPRLRAFFGLGDLSWEQTRAICRVATLESESRWIEFAVGQPIRTLLAEVSEAMRAGRDAPRERAYGLPNLMVRLCIDLTIEDRERVRAAFEMVGVSASGDLGRGTPGGSDGTGADVDDGRPPLVRWADAVLAGEIPVGPARATGGSSDVAPKPAPAQTILYRTCPECRHSTLDTPDGPVVVPPSRVDELASVSNRVRIRPEEEAEPEPLPAGELDRPNGARLTRQVLHRDGLRCANPGCGRRERLHAHHIDHRADGGRTTLSNEVTVCDRCHALLHKGLLEVSGSPDTGLTWTPKPLDPRVTVRDVDGLRRQLAELTAALFGSEVAPSPADGQQSAAADYLTHLAPAASTDATERERLPGTRASDMGPHFPRPNVPLGPSRGALPVDPRLVDDLAEGLVALGWRRGEGQRAVVEAYAALAEERLAAGGPSPAEEPFDDGVVFLRALRGR